MLVDVKFAVTLFCSTNPVEETAPLSEVVAFEGGLSFGGVLTSAGPETAFASPVSWIVVCCEAFTLTSAWFSPPTRTLAVLVLTTVFCAVTPREEDCPVAAPVERDVLWRAGVSLLVSTTAEPDRAVALPESTMVLWLSFWTRRPPAPGPVTALESWLLTSVVWAWPPTARVLPLAAPTTGPDGGAALVGLVPAVWFAAPLVADEPAGGVDGFVPVPVVVTVVSDPAPFALDVPPGVVWFAGGVPLPALVDVVDGAGGVVTAALFEVPFVVPGEVLLPADPVVPPDCPVEPVPAVVPFVPGAVPPFVVELEPPALVVPVVVVPLALVDWTVDPVALVPPVLPVRLFPAVWVVDAFVCFASGCPLVDVGVVVAVGVGFGRLSVVVLEPPVAVALVLDPEPAVVEAD